jgi:hypothetical protein
LFTSLPVVVVDCVLVLDWFWSIVEPLVEAAGVWLVVSAGVVPVALGVEVAVPVVPPVVDVAEDWLFMSVPLAPVGVALEPVVAALPVELWLASGTCPTWPLLVEVGEVADGDCWFVVSIVWLVELDDGEALVLLDDVAL